MTVPSENTAFSQERECMSLFLSRRLLCLLIGYSFGNILTAAIVARVVAHQSVFLIGNGNPGMTNIRENLGFFPGAFTMLGDVFKCVFACTISRYASHLGALAAAWAGLGVCLGHCFPVWTRKGGKAVQSMTAVIVLIDPYPGIFCDLFCMLLQFSIGYPPLGAISLPLTFVPFAFYRHGLECGMITILLVLLMVNRQWDGLLQMKAGTLPHKAWLFHRKSEEKTDGTLPEPEERIEANSHQVRADLPTEIENHPA